MCMVNRHRIKFVNREEIKLSAIVCLVIIFNTKVVVEIIYGYVGAENRLMQSMLKIVFVIEKQVVIF